VAGAGTSTPSLFGASHGSVANKLTAAAVESWAVLGRQGRAGGGCSTPPSAWSQDVTGTGEILKAANPSVEISWWANRCLFNGKG